MLKRKPLSKATIVIEIDENFLGQSYTYNTGGHKHPTVMLINKFAEVLVNSDGRPEILGDSLLGMFSEDESIDDERELLDRVYYDIIAEGDCNVISEPLYNSRKNDNWNDFKPIFTGTCPEIKEDYQYLFSNREWYVRSEIDESLYDFTKLSEVLKDKK